MKATFENSVDILVKAYFEGALMPLDCRACAVGQLMGGNSQWANLFTCTRYIYAGDKVLNSDGNRHSKRKELPELYAKKLEHMVLTKTGYQWDELAKIEFAFVTHSGGRDDLDSVFNGLMAVVEVLAEIHGIDLTTKESAKLLFAKA